MSERELRMAQKLLEQQGEINTLRKIVAVTKYVRDQLAKEPVSTVHGDKWFANPGITRAWMELDDALKPVEGR